MIRFECDYAEGAHIKILEKLMTTNEEQTQGYGEDEYSINAKRYIQKMCKNDDVDVHFLVGGTQTNLTVISSILRSHQGVIAAQSGHINVHETGAIEATGHKVITLESKDGKITAKQVQEVFDLHWNDSNHEHMVQPGMVYISHPTENGTTYTKKELQKLSEVCRQCHLPLFMDGARLGYALVAETNDLTLEEIAKLCDIFYIGGTKVGALFGEAVVISNELLKKDFRYHMKQKGGMLAKGRLLGIQFETLFENGLYLEISENAVKKALQIRDAFKKKGYTFLYDSFTNQQFPILSNQIIKDLSKKYAFFVWEQIDKDYSAVRFCTSWATTEKQIQSLLEDISKLKSYSFL
ncbi:MAG TPA: low specificity L-threonine aldolase [Lachnospiraceae bacterium]|nr:low specificity L-threonine aldolase [Lachnospiraceae bacterium]